MTLQFNAAPYLQLLEARRQAQQRPDINETVTQPIFQGLGALNQLQQQKRQNAMQDFQNKYLTAKANVELGSDWQNPNQPATPMAMSPTQPQQSFQQPDQSWGQETETPTPTIQPPGRSALVDQFNQFAQTIGHPEIPHPGDMATTTTPNPIMSGGGRSQYLLGLLRNPNLGSIRRKQIEDQYKLERDAEKSTDKGYTPEQLNALSTGDLSKLSAAFKGTVPEKAATLASTIGNRAETARYRDYTMGERSDQFDQKEWDRIVKETNPLTAASRTPLGMASRANLNADRAITTLSKPVVTYQEAGNVMADIAGIYQGGSPTNTGLTHQEYNTLYGTIQKGIQSLTGNPQDALPNALKQRLLQDLQEMKQTNRKVISQNLDVTERSKKKIISNHPDEWKGIRQTLEGDGEPSNSAQQFNSVGDAEAANLPKGTRIMIGGRWATVQ